VGDLVVTKTLSLSLDVSAVPANPAGAGRYTVALADALLRRDDVALELISRRSDSDRWHALGQQGLSLRVAPLVPNSRFLRLAYEQMRLGAALSGRGNRVHHSPHYTMPEHAKIPVVVTIHDCTFFDHPEWHERLKVPVFRRAITVACKRAAVLICVSQTTKDRLVTLLSPSVPIVVAPHGVDHNRFSPDEPTLGADRAALSSLGIAPTTRYIFYLGTLEPRKGVDHLLDAFSSLADDDGEVALVLAGQPGWRGEAIDAAFTRAQRHRSRIFNLGYVPDDAVPALLRNAQVVAYPSLEEGYGLPALEALACGAPLVTTKGTAMAEFAGSVATLVAPNDTYDLAAGLAAVLAQDESDPKRGAARAQGLEIARGRTWAEAAEAHMGAYRLALG